MSGYMRGRIDGWKIVGINVEMNKGTDKRMIVWINGRMDGLINE